MTEPGRADDDDERETLAGDSSPPRDAGTEPGFGDLESLPPRRPSRPASSGAGKLPPKPKLPDEGETFAGTPATEGAPFAQGDASIPSSEAATVPPPSTETPTREIEINREMATIAGTFAGTDAGGGDATVDPGETPTIAEVPASEAVPPTARHTRGTDQSARKAPTGYKSPLSKAASRTARDPIVGSAAMRGTGTGSIPAGVGGLAEGQLIADRYELVTRLGKGGMGEVWKARHILLQGLRAIKVIKASISKDPSFRQRFLQEGQTMMRVKHRGVVEVTDLDETRAHRELFMVMEYLEGRTIYDAIRDKDRPLAADVRNATRVLREVADGMQRIHDERIVHKDLKSDNVLLVTDKDDGLEHPKVIDFGLAKRLGDADQAPVADTAGTASPSPYDADLRTTLSGTLAYMAPEQFRHEPSSFQSDIYAFGVMAFEVFTKGDYPLPRGPLLHYMDLHKAGKVPERLAAKRPDLDPALAAVFDRCMAPARDARPASFRDVVADLDWWLAAPERAARRKRKLLLGGAIALPLVIAALAILFGGEKTASLSNLTLTAAGRTQPLQAVGKRIYLGGAALPALQLAADIAGKPGSAVLDVDGETRPADAEVRDGRLTATADLSGLADGEHSLSWRASPSAAPVTVTIDVDRVAPVFRSVSVRGSPAGPAGVFTRAQSPEVLVELDEPAARIGEIVAASGKSVVAAQRDGDAERWVLKGTSNGDGAVELEISARDLAGNVATSSFRYVRDTEGPTLSVIDEYGLDKPVTDLHVRSASGEHLRASVVDSAASKEAPLVVRATFAGSAPVEKTLAGRGTLDFALPDIPRSGLAATVTVSDAAGNELVREFTVQTRPDGVVMTDGERKFARTIGPREDVTVVIQRDYQVGPFKQMDPVALEARRVRDAIGEPVEGESAAAVQSTAVNVMFEGRIVVPSIAGGSLPEGSFEISPAFLPGVRTKPYLLTVDGTPPVIESVTVREESGREVGSADWALTADLVVTAVVTDLSPERVTLGGRPPEEDVLPGRRTYTFRGVRCEREGTNTWPLVVADGSRQSDSRTVSVRADWSTPSFRLDGPADGASLDDVTQTFFRGECEGESNYEVFVEGIPGVPAKSASFTTRGFELPVQLPASEGMPLTLYVVDAAKHRSAPAHVTVKVRHVGTELAPEITWRRGATALMEQVEPGDVVIGGHVRAVARAFVDRTEVTNADYRLFLAAARAAGGHGPWCHAEEPKGWDHAPAAATFADPKWNADALPVVNVAWWDAWAFAHWSGRRLATEAEWVKAAAKGKAKGETELRRWPPFGPGEWREGVIATSETVKGPVAAGDGADVSPVGCLHMGGNVSEWIDAAGGGAAASAATRGGSWYFSKAAADVRSTPAKAWDPSFRASTIGFRCAVDASQVQP